MKERGQRWSLFIVQLEGERLVFSRLYVLEQVCKSFFFYFCKVGGDRSKEIKRAPEKIYLMKCLMKIDDTILKA